MCKVGRGLVVGVIVSTEVRRAVRHDVLHERQWRHTPHIAA